MSSAKIPQIIIGGQVTLDTLISPRGSHQDLPGGSALYISGILAKRNIKTGIISRIGEDFPKDTLKKIESSGIDISGVKITEQPSDTFRIERKDGEVSAFEMQHLCGAIGLDDIPKHFQLCKWLHLCSMDLDFFLDLLNHAITKKITLSISLQHYFDYTHNLDNIDTRIIKNILAHTRILFCNRWEICALAKMHNDRYIDAAQLVATQGPKTLVVTLGDRGCIVIHNKSMSEFKSHHYIRDVVDETGAGDAFAAGFLSEYLFNKSLQSCVNQGSFMAERTIQTLGASFIFSNQVPTEM